MIVRHAIADDRESVIRCARLYEHFGTDDERVGLLFDMSLATDGMFVAVVAHTVVGFLCTIQLPHPFGGFDYLDVIAFFVAPPFRGTSAAGRLLRAMLRWCSTLPLDMVKMSAPNNSRLGTILHRAGFSAVETVYLKGSRWQAHRR